ncbi:MAG: hypothetical protein SVY10_17720, partial [Thermodesulfobacteriota bacterium]|nr:hypothetical protein [Thermodesulfobacteriota bacterium]
KSLIIREYDSSSLHAEYCMKGYVIIPDRRKAIESAIFLAHPQDVVLIAGKGHENYQILGDKKIPFDDRQEAREAIERRRRRFIDND